MDTSRISFGEMIAGASGLALFIILFFPWYGVSLEGAGSDFDGPDFSAWESFSFIDILLFLVSVITVGLVLARAMGAMPAGLPAPPGLIIAAAGALALLLVLFRLIDTPGEDFSGFGVEADITPQDRRLPRPDRICRDRLRRLDGDERARFGRRVAGVMLPTAASASSVAEAIRQWAACSVVKR